METNPSMPRIGVLLPHTGMAASAASIKRFAGMAEQAGVDSLWVGDHVALAGSSQTAEYPYAEGKKKSYEVPYKRPFLEPWVSLGFAAAVTERCGLGLGVGILPYRPALLWAKLAGTLQLLSEGRFQFGVGVGWMRDEFDALGVPYERRGALTDETLELLEVVRHAEDGVTFHGERFDVADMHVNPSLREPEAPPIWVGGNGKAARRRTARFGDVWYPHIYRLSPQAFGERLAELRDEARDYGRSGDLSGAMHAPLFLEDEPGAEPWQTGEIHGPATYVAELLVAYREAGVDHVTLSFGGSPDSRMRILDELFAALR